MKALTALVAAATILCSGGCVAIDAAPRLFGGTRTYAGVFAGRDFLAARRAPQPYQHTSGTMGLKGLLIPLAVVDFLPSLAVDLLLLPVSIPYTIQRHSLGGRAEPEPVDHRRANEDQAVAALYDIALAQRTFKLTDAEGDRFADYAKDFAELQKVRDGLGEEAHGYRFRLHRSETAPSLQWLVTAAPIEPGVTGSRYFAIDSSGVVAEAETPFEVLSDCVRRGGQPLDGVQ
jgi:hypothetical protein